MHKPNQVRWDWRHLRTSMASTQMQPALTLLKDAIPLKLSSTTSSRRHKLPNKPVATKKSGTNEEDRVNLWSAQCVLAKLMMTALAQDAAFCEGECNAWFYHWCVRLSKNRYIKLSISEKPFLCPWCTISIQ